MKKFVVLCSATGVFVLSFALWTWGMHTSAPASTGAQVIAGTVDSDGDGVTNAQEAILRTNPNKADSDGDGRSDGIEMLLDLNPNSLNADAGVPVILHNGPDSLLINDKGTIKTVMKDFAALTGDAKKIEEMEKRGEGEAKVSFVPNQLLVKLDPSSSLGGSLLTSANSLSRLESILDDVVDVAKVQKAFTARKAIPASAPGAYQMKIAEEMAGLDLIYEVEVAGGNDLQQIARSLEERPGIAWAQPNYILSASLVPNDPYFSTSGAFGQTYRDMWGLTAINADKAWDLTQGQGITVAVVDTGIDTQHPDLKDNLWKNPGEIPGNGIDDDNNGFKDDVMGWNFTNKTPDITDGNGHGTHVSGTIAGVGNNGIGVTGVAFKSKIMALPGLNAQGQGTVDDLAAAIVYAADNKAHVINMSFGGNTGGMPNPVLETALAYAVAKGVVTVAAAGNDNIDARNTSPVNARLAIGVGADTPQMKRASFSNYGSRIDISAPGGGDTSADIRNIISTMSPGTLSGLLPSLLVSQGYYRLAGTSMATPHVAGAVALLLAHRPELMQNPALTMSRVRDLLRATSTPLPSADPFIGTGRIDIYKAMTTQGTSPIAILDGLDGSVIGGIVSISGTASGQPFQSYTLQVKPDTGTTWQTLVTSQSPVSGDVLFANWDTTDLVSGVYDLRLSVKTANGMHNEVEVQVLIRSFKLSKPFNNDVIRLGDVVDVKGTAQGKFDSYIVEYGKGFDPAQWLTAGVALQGGGTQEVVDGLLARWDTSVIPVTDGGFYSMRFSVKRAGKNDVVILAKMLFLDPTIKKGWPVKVPSGTGLQYSNVAQVADLDGDGKAEIISMGTHNLAQYVAGTYVVQRPTLRVYSLEGTLLWERLVDGGDSPYFIVAMPPVIVNWGTGGKKAIVVERQSACWNSGTGENGSGTCEFYAFDDKGTPLPGWPKKINTTYFGAWMRKVAVDTNGDGTHEIVIFPVGPAWGVGDSGNIINVLFSDGSVKTLKHVEQCIIGSQRPPDFAIGNFIGTKMQVALPMGRDCDSVTLMNLDDGSIVPGWPRKLTGVDFASVAAGDLNGDGKDELVTYSADVAFFNSAPTAAQKGGTLHVFTGNGQYLPGWPKKVNTSDTQFGHNSVAIGDLNGDGKSEIVYAPHMALNSEDCALRVFFADGTEAGSRLTTTTEKPCDEFIGHFPTSAVIADVNGNGRPDILYSGNGLNYNEITAGKPNRSGGIWAWEPDATLSTFTLIDLNGPSLAGKALAEESPGAGMVFVKTREPPTVTLNPQNGRVVIISATQDDGDKFRGNKGTDSIFAWELPFQARPEASFWPMYQHDNQRTGRAGLPVAAPHPGPAECGNGTVTAPETCDDANATNGDGCSSACAIEAGYTCSGTPSVCSKSQTGCGDGKIAAPETCDDGNKTAGDGCSATCGTEGGFACIDRGTPTVPQTACWTCPAPQPASSLATVTQSGLYKGKKVFTVTFPTEAADTAQLTKELQFVLTPASAMLSQGARLSDAFPAGASVYGYKYSDRNASLELAAREAGSLFPFPGEFFVSDAMKTANPTLVASLQAKGATVKALKDVTLTRDSRYLMVAGEAGAVLKIKYLLCKDLVPLPIGGGKAACGNGKVETGETCDDANTKGEDGCTACKVDAGYTCTGAPSACAKTPSAPPAPVCGDGVKHSTEGCDDGNTKNADGCSAVCAIESGWTCTGASPSVCTPNQGGAGVCGNGKYDTGEACDDGNTKGGDGCSSTCTAVETGFNCNTTLTPSSCFVSNCQDADGADISRPSITIHYNSYPDICGSQEHIITENYCIGGSMTQATVSCPIGTKCQSGPGGASCVPGGPPPSGIELNCSDPDGGFKVGVAGTASVPGISEKDTCVQANGYTFLQEAYCQRNFPFPTVLQVICPAGTTCQTGPNGAACL